MTSLIKFVETLQAVEKEFISEEDESKKEDRFIDLLNILETYCAAYNARLLPAKTKEIVRDKLVDSMALVRNSQIWAKKYAEAQLGQTAFSELKRFEKSHRRRIASASKAFSTPPPPASVA